VAIPFSETAPVRCGFNSVRRRVSVSNE